MKRPRECSPAEAAALVRSVDSIGTGLGPGQPIAFLQALGERDAFEQLHVFAGFLSNLYPLFAKPGVHLFSGFYGPAERLLSLAGHRVRFVPSDFRRFGPILQAHAPRIMATAAAPPDARGRLSLSLHAGATADELLRAARDPERLLIVETSPQFPRTRGVPPEYEHAIALEEVDVWVRSQSAPLAIPEPEPTALERAISEHVHRFIPDGATLQTGVGGVPSAITALLAERSGGDYGIHSEVYTSALMRLQRSGKVTNRKGVYDGTSIATFAIGSAELYRWLDAGGEVAFLPVDRVNDPAVIARNRSMRSINSGLAIDLFGQVAADTLGGRQYSGTGGHEDFTGGASLAPGGRSFVCLPSTAQVQDGVVSRITGRLPVGALVSTPRHQIDVVVTEHGAAELFGRTVEERAEALIAIAHPDFRDELGAAWDKLARG